MCNSLCSDGCLLFVGYCLLVVVCCLLFGVWCSLLVVCCVLFDG